MATGGTLHRQPHEAPRVKRAVEVALLTRAHLASDTLSGCFVTESHSLESFVPPGGQPQIEPRNLITLVLTDWMGASVNRTMLVRTARYHRAVGVGKA